ncbi:formate dehydrogenase accessory sulfurtransferase FdhD [Candidatus Laterigemmans baculatus]|uniref:formate dehydrogenase accessory sulfurtransferase FdhD n=1 Tax=Candidatus Laterigemmans baculatus TaxID=2770505 RepID=UPI0013DB44E7|nr:formate dehydrogenase accessory sulfurtransferase FdhD [Candidatus Laterigemmans baculatus]
MTVPPLPPGARELPVHRVRAGLWTAEQDALAIEEPLETRLIYHRRGRRRRKTIAVTMRTPGHDVELAVGFLFAEGILNSRSDLRVAAHFGPVKEEGIRNIVQVELRPDASVDLERLKRNFYTSSSCGVCGKASIESLRVSGCARLSAEDPRVDPALIASLPAKLREAQAVFASTGGLHAAALFDASGTLRWLREDVGRHNALDKLVGRQWLDGRLPSSDSLLVLSGRASFELMQKAARAGIPIVIAIGAPSTLAVELAREHGITLIGFARENRFNIYSGERRVRAPRDRKIGEI